MSSAQSWCARPPRSRPRPSWRAPRRSSRPGLLMGLESSSARAEQMARQLLLFDRLMEPPELIERIDSVTAEAVRALAAKLVSGSQPSVAVVGAGRKGQGFARMAAERVARGSGAARDVRRATGRMHGLPEIHFRNRWRGRGPRPGGVAAPPGDGRLRGLGRAERHEPPAPDALGAAVVARRADALRLPSAPAPVSARAAGGPGLRLPRLSPGAMRRCSAGSASATCGAASRRRPRSATGSARRTSAAAT